jgi:hypothetical protein
MITESACCHVYVVDTTDDTLYSANTLCWSLHRVVVIHAMNAVVCRYTILLSCADYAILPCYCIVMVHCTVYRSHNTASTLAGIDQV